MSYVLLGGLGLLVGLLVMWPSGWILGLGVGLLAAQIFALRKRLARLEQHLNATLNHIRDTAIQGVMPQGPPPRHVSTPPPPARPSPGTVKTDRDSAPARPAPETPAAFTTPAPPAAETPPGPEPPPAAGFHFEETPGREAVADLPDRVAGHVKAFFTTGNVVTKIGVIVLFFGFAFLLKYAAQRNLVPIEFRLIGVFLGGLGLLGAGWRLRKRRRIYGLTLQGGGVGVLYLTVYAAARFYHLLPYELAFVVMFVLVILSGILAVLQDARPLALFGIAGGFLAPVLLSTDTGSHVVLFSYYALLNLGIVVIAWRKAWRGLNLIGFVFTFVIASLWGANSYQPRYFRSTEPFLILFFIYYVALAVLYALRQPPKLRGYVDGTLVFGTPLAAFGLQYGLVRDMEYGLAMSALALGLVYILLAAGLRRRNMASLGMLTESFLAFGVVFGSLAIPLALDGRWTSAAWALEGAAILWIGIRQNRLLARIFGVLLQAGSGISFLVAAELPFRQTPVVNGFFVGCVLISLAGLFSSWYATRRSEALHPWERYVAVPLMVWGLAWWFGAAFVETDRFAPRPDWISAVVAHAALSFFLIEAASRRLAWKSFCYPPLLLLPMMFFLATDRMFEGGGAHLFARMGFVAWGATFLVQYRLLFQCETTWPHKMVVLWHQVTLWLLLLILTVESAYGMTLLVPGGKTWSFCAWGAVPGVAILVLLRWGERLSWPVRRFLEAYLGTGVALPLAGLFGWAVLINLHHGDPSPLPFVPVINPVELTQIFLLLIMVYWIHHRREWLQRKAPSPSTVEGPAGDGLAGPSRAPALTMVVYGAGFLLLNAVVARTIHFWAEVPYTAEGLYRSVLFQASVSILWGVTALVTTLVATRKRSRTAWIAGASILVLVVIKLFVVDLAGTGTVARIVSFLCVGSLMLLIGYFSPLPPAHAKEVS